MKRINFLFLVVVLGGVFWQFFVPGPRVAGDFPYNFPENQKAGFNLPFTWTTRLAEGLGEYTVATLWSWPGDFIYGLGASLDISFPVLERIFGIFPILILGVWGISKLFNDLKISGWGKWVGALFYLTNTYILLLIDGGQLNLALAYSVLPLAFVQYRYAIEGKTWRRRIFFALVVLALSIFDIRIVYFLAILIGFDFIFEIFLSRRSFFVNLKSYFYTGLLASVILIGFHAYWILPAVFAKAPSLPLTYERPAQVESLSFATIGHSIYMLQPHWFKNVFGKVTPLQPEFVFIPILVFLAPILLRKDRWVGFWLVIALVGVFLSKGSNEPLSHVYQWLFSNIPGFSLFRDPTKFFFLIALSYSILLGMAINELTKVIQSTTHHLHTLTYVSKYIVSSLSLIVIIYLVWLARPVWLGQMTGTFSKPILESEYFELANKLEKDYEFGRIFWIPTKAPLGYSSPTHPSVEAVRLIQRRPFAIGTIGTYEFFNFLREAPFMDEIFDIAGIKYIIYPFPDIRREELKPDNIKYYNTFLNQLSLLPWTVPVATDSPVAVLATRRHQDHFFVPKNLWWVIGSDDIYNELVKIPGFQLNDNAMVFAEEQVELGSKIGEVPSAQILINQKGEIDLAASLLGKEFVLFPTTQIGFHPDKSGWWKRETADQVSWRDFLQQKYGIDNLDFDLGGGWAVAEQNQKLNIKNQKFTEGNILLARVMGSSKGGEVEFYQGGTLIGSIDTKIIRPEKTKFKLTGFGEVPDRIFEYDKAIVAWHEVGRLTINHLSADKAGQPLTIKTDGGINVVNALAVVPVEEWEKAKTKATALIKERGVLWDRLTSKEKQRLFVDSQNATATYERISPTHYKVQVSGLKKPTILIFSENYDGLWQMDGENSLPFYSLINGFPIEGDGQYEVKFAAQKYVFPGFLLTITTLILVISLLVLVKR